MECPRARERIRIGLPATVEQGTHRQSTGPSGAEASTALVMTATENFITLLDAIKIGMVEKDMLHPLLVDVIQSANSVTDVEFDSKGEIVKWLIKLNHMGAAEKLSAEDQRQFQFDMDQAYKGFKRSI
jgi:ESCRT-I complex subunit VPS28